MSGFWNTMPAWLRISHVLLSSRASIPSTVKSPSCGESSTLMCFANVDFPLPLCPKIATNSPRRTSSVMPASAMRVFSSSSIYTYFRSLLSIAGICYSFVHKKRDCIYNNHIIYRKSPAQPPDAPGQCPKVSVSRVASSAFSIFRYTSSSMTTSAASPRLGPIFSILVYPPPCPRLFSRSAYLGAISLNSFSTTGYFTSAVR